MTQARGEPAIAWLGAGVRRQAYSPVAVTTGADSPQEAEIPSFRGRDQIAGVRLRRDVGTLKAVAWHDPGLARSVKGRGDWDQSIRSEGISLCCLYFCSASGRSSLITTRAKVRSYNPILPNSWRCTSSLLGVVDHPFGRRIEAPLSRYMDPLGRIPALLNFEWVCGLMALKSSLPAMRKRTVFGLA